MKTILLTGSNGFTGGYLKSLFTKKGYKVKGITLNNPGQNEIACDLTDKSRVNEVIRQIKPDGIIHLAAQSFVAHEDASELYKINVLGATNILEALDHASLHPNKVIVASSANVYGSPKDDIITEETCPAPVNHYAASKLAMEHMVMTWSERFPIIITRPFNYTGVGQDDKFLAPKIVKHFQLNKTSIQLGNLDVSRDFSDVRDIARAYHLLYESTMSTEIFNLSSNNVYSLRQLITTIEEIAGYKIAIEVNPEFVRDNEIKILNGSNEKLHACTGYQPEFTLVDTLKNMYAHSS